MRRAAALLGLGALLLIGAADADPKTETEHTVKTGETLGGIANRAEVPRVLIIEANGLKAPFEVHAGQKLVIPRRRNHTVKDGETGFSIALDYGVPWSVIAAANGIDQQAPVKPGQVLAIPTLAKGATSAAPAPQASAASTVTPPAKPLKDTAAPAFGWPLHGKIRRKFTARGGKDDFHDGIDILTKLGTAVRASASGKVIFAGQGPKEYGLTVIVYHTGRWTTTYSFLDKVTVKEGDKVKAGERVGLAGQTGLAGEPQLHFEVRRNRVALDPVKYLPEDD